MQHLQEAIGNAAVSRLVSEFGPGKGNAGVAVGPEPPAPAAAIPTWTVPANLVPDLFGSTMAMTTRDQVALFLTAAKLKIERLKTKMEPADDTGIVSMVSAIDAQKKKFTGSDALTAADVVDMDIFAKLARFSLDSVLDKISDEIKATLEPLKDKADPDKLDGLKTDVAEEMHEKFMEGNEDALAHLREVLEELNHYKEIVSTFTPWVEGTIKILAGAHTIEMIERFAHGSEYLFKGVNILRGVLDAGKAVQMALTHAGASGMEAELQNFELALDVIDVTMTFAEAVPLVGTLWTFYYKPLTKACIRMLHQIAKARDKEIRDLTLAEWMSQPRPDGATPLIPKEVMRFFPGGQPVLDVMYPAVNGRGISMNSAAEQFFLSKRDLFNAGARGQMESQSNWHVFDPWSWGAPDTSPNIVSFLEDNKDSVWSMLYGNMPHALR